MHSLSIPGFGRVPFSVINDLDRPPFVDQRRLSNTMDFFHLKDRHLNKEKRLSLSVLGRPLSSGKGSPKLAASKLARLDIVEESPPLVSYGPPRTSTGALLSAQLTLFVLDSEIKINSLDMKLTVKITLKKPISKDCSECGVKLNELKHWTFITEPTTYTVGSHSLPFSYLLPGNLPATTRSKVASIDYVLSARASSDVSEDITFSRVLTLQRALQPPELPRTSIRIFPPTNLQGRVRVPAVIHPIGEFNVEFEMTGTMETEKQSGTKHRWQIRKLDWHIDETSECISAPCPRHAHKVGDGKGILQKDTRNIGSGGLTSGFKTDDSTVAENPDRLGWTGVEFSFNVKSGMSKPAVCDVESNTPGIVKVTHALVLELIIVEEICLRKRETWMSTSQARSLRSQFAVILTEQGGMGISWDEEQPPMYENVPSSPPMYAVSTTSMTPVEDYQVEPLLQEEDEGIPIGL